tara:strand:+ start:10262 stop:10591 length:330 start_codon:yes stop_codon:yes gene_type:complete
MTTKLEGWTNRQKDTGWGYSVAHLIPFVGIYYAITRRTITPFLYNILGTFVLGFCYGFVYAAIDPAVEDKELENGGRLIGLVSTPFLVKQGIDKARKFGKDKLDSNSKN